MVWGLVRMLWGLFQLNILWGEIGPKSCPNMIKAVVVINIGCGSKGVGEDMDIFRFNDPMKGVVFK